MLLLVPIDLADPRAAMPWLVLLRSHIREGFKAARAGLRRTMKVREARHEIDRCEGNALRLIEAAELALPPGTIPHNWDPGDDADPPSTKP